MFDELISEFYEMIKCENVRKLLSRGAYQESYLLEFAPPGEIMLEANRLEVQTERRFAVALESGLLEGSIDRLVLVHQGNQVVAADVIDFKTDSVDGTNLQERIEYYRPQMDGYRLAASRFAGIALDKISTRLVFVQSGQVVNLDLIESTIDGPTETRPAASRSRFAPPKPHVSEAESGKQRQKTLWD